jgi:hypothetical protein
MLLWLHQCNPVFASIFTTSFSMSLCFSLYRSIYHCIRSQCKSWNISSQVAVIIPANNLYPTRAYLWGPGEYILWRVTIALLSYFLMNSVLLPLSHNFLIYLQASLIKASDYSCYILLITSRGRLIFSRIIYQLTYSSTFDNLNFAP